MSLLTPMFLAGLAALALPVLLHLVDRADRDGRRFPSLMFVRRLPYRAQRRRLLRDRVLLALRCLALALLALAFARPFTAGERDAPAVPEIDLVVLLDRSYSMAAGDRWPRAFAVAAERLAAVGDDGRVALVLFDANTQTVSELRDDPAEALALLASAGPGHAGTDFALAFGAASALLASSPAKRRVVLLVSDLQRIGLAEGARLWLPEGVELEAAAIGAEPLANATLAVQEARAGGDGEEGVLRLQISDAGDVPVADLELVVEVDGRVVARRRMAVGERVVEVPLPAGSSRPLRVAARIAGDDLGADDSVALVVAPSLPLRVVLVLPDQAAGNRGVFIERALAVARQPRVVVRRVAASAVDTAALAEADVIVLDDAALADTATWSLLRSRVDAGAGLLLVAGERLGDTWPSASRWLPGVPGAVREAAASDGLALRWRDRAHPLAAALGAHAGGAGETLAAGVHRYRSFSAGDGDAVVAVFDDDAPALLERTLGAGRIMVYASTLDTRWSALAATPVFAPLMVQTVRHLAARGPQPQARAVGEVVDLAGHAAALGATGLAAHLRAGGAALVRLPDGSSMRVGNALVDTTQPGFHEIHAVGADLPPVPLAVIVDTRESDASLLRPEALLARVDEAPPARERVRAAAERRFEQSGADRLWWWLLLAAVLVLLAESLLARRLADERRPRPVSGVGA